jgi:hypothetical protein
LTMANELLHNQVQRQVTGRPDVTPQSCATLEVSISSD